MPDKSAVISVIITLTIYPFSLCKTKYLIIQVGTKVTNSDCSQTYFCPAAGQNVTISSLSCSLYASCGVNSQGDLGCQCLPGYYGNGSVCTDSKNNISFFDKRFCDLNKIFKKKTHAMLFHHLVVLELYARK